MFKVWFPKYEAREITVYRQPERPTYVEIEVRWGRYDSMLDTIVPCRHSTSRWH